MKTLLSKVSNVPEYFCLCLQKLLQLGTARPRSPGCAFPKKTQPAAHRGSQTVLVEHGLLRELGELRFGGQNQHLDHDAQAYHHYQLKIGEDGGARNDFL